MDYITDQVLICSGILEGNEEIEEENGQDVAEEENEPEALEEEEHDQHQDFQKEIRQAIYDYLDELDRPRLRGHDYVR